MSKDKDNIAKMVNEVFSNDHEKAFQMSDLIDNLTTKVSVLIEDDGLWEEMIGSKHDRVMFVAMIGSIAIAMAQMLEPVVDIIFDDDKE